MLWMLNGLLKALKTYQHDGDVDKLVRYVCALNTRLDPACLKEILDKPDARELLDYLVSHTMS